MNDKEWQAFLLWLYKTHSITKDWIPNRISIELWLEYKEVNNGNSNIS